MSKCLSCGSLDLRRRLLPEYEAQEIGISGVVLNNAITEERCGQCGNIESISIPNLQGLIAAVAVMRAQIDLKLRGNEIRFMRKAMELTAEQLAAKLEVRKEAISRWENEAEPMGPQSEKLLRWMAAQSLAKLTIVKFDPETIASMKIRAWHPVDEPLKMPFVLVQPSVATRKVPQRGVRVKEVWKRAA